jgi:hypothetical protein
MDKRLLRNLVVHNKLSTREIASALKVSQTTVMYWRRKLSILTPKKRYLCKCGETSPSKFVNMGGGRRHRSRCKKCHSNNTRDRFRRNKQRAVEYLGGKCVKCGYSRCAGALDFHHPNPSIKPKDWSKISTWGWTRLKKAIKGCILLCATCHREEHWLEGL